MVRHQYEFSDLQKLELKLLCFLSSMNVIKVGLKDSNDMKNIANGYSLLHSNYTHLAITSQHLEALKRAIFIQWYATSEPFFLTGIGDLEKSFELSALRELQSRHILKSLDEEFYWMLQCYCGIDDSFLTAHEGFEEFIEFIESLPPWDTTLKTRYSFSDRGCMGLYWMNRGG